MYTPCPSQAKHASLARRRIKSSLSRPTAAPRNRERSRYHERTHARSTGSHLEPHPVSQQTLLGAHRRGREDCVAWPAFLRNHREQAVFCDTKSGHLEHHHRNVEARCISQHIHQFPRKVAGDEGPFPYVTAQTAQSNVVCVRFLSVGEFVCHDSSAKSFFKILPTWIRLDSRQQRVDFLNPVAAPGLDGLSFGFYVSQNRDGIQQTAIN
jgi:hypothetical protein